MAKTMSTSSSASAALTGILISASIIFSACSEAKEKALEVKAEAERKARDLQSLVVVSQQVKSELEKIYNTTTDYDLIISDPESGEDKLKAHQEQIARMNHIEVENLTVGYEERQDRSFQGATYERHLRATWVADGKLIGVSYYSKKEVDLKAFEELVRKMIPIVNNQMRQRGLL